jgi:NAD(P)-dependent dehydrogenase (short-subunit alcohol dehydrogenase family)
MDLSDKRALTTVGTSGIGALTARSTAAEGARGRGDHHRPQQNPPSPDGGRDPTGRRRGTVSHRRQYPVRRHWTGHRSDERVDVHANYAVLGTSDIDTVTFDHRFEINAKQPFFLVGRLRSGMPVVVAV